MPVNKSYTHCSFSITNFHLRAGENSSIKRSFKMACLSILQRRVANTPTQCIGRHLLTCLYGCSCTESGRPNCQGRLSLRQVENSKYYDNRLRSRSLHWKTRKTTQAQRSKRAILGCCDPTTQGSFAQAGHLQSILPTKHPVDLLSISWRCWCLLSQPLIHIRFATHKELLRNICSKICGIKTWDRERDALAANA